MNGKEIKQCDFKGSVAQERYLRIINNIIQRFIGWVSMLRESTEKKERGTRNVTFLAQRGFWTSLK